MPTRRERMQRTNNQELPLLTPELRAATFHDDILNAIIISLDQSECAAATIDEIFVCLPAFDQEAYIQILENRLNSLREERDRLRHPEVHDDPPAPDDSTEPDDWMRKTAHRLGRLNDQRAHDGLEAFRAFLETTINCIREDSTQVPSELADHPDLREQFKIFNHALDKSPGYFLLHALLNPADREASIDAVESVHALWKDVDSKHPFEFKHPLAPIVEECLKRWAIQKNAKRIDTEHERTKPGGLLPHKSAAAIRAGLHHETSDSPVVQDPPPVGQLIIPSPEFESPLPDILPLQMVEGVPLTTRPGHVSVPVRLVFEGAMALEGKERRKDFSKTLGEFTGLLSSHLKRIQRRDIDFVINAIRQLDAIRIPYIDPVGGPGTFRPVIAWNEPRDGANSDFLVHFRSQWPEDDNGGTLVIKAIVRNLYTSAAKFNQYLTACNMFNRHGRNPQGGLINPSMPDPESPRCPKTNALLDPTRENSAIIVNEKGYPVKDIYHPAAVKVLPRIYRPEAKAYKPIEDTRDIIRMAYPHLDITKMSKSTIRDYKRRALKELKDLINKGFIDGLETKHGWQLLPTPHHVNLHNAIRKNNQHRH